MNSTSHPRESLNKYNTCLVMYMYMQSFAARLAEIAHLTLHLLLIASWACSL